MTPFQKELPPIPSGLPFGKLSLYHVTLAHRIARIVHARKLTPGECDVFGRRMLYLSYGAAYYRPPSGTTEDRNRLPIAFVFDNSLMASLDRFFPFDTGAVFRGRCGRDWKSTLSPLENYSSSDSDAPERIVACFYGSNAKYVQGVVRSRFRKPGITLRTVHKFLRTDLSSINIDARQRTVECVSSVDVELVDHVRCIMYPSFVAPHIERLAKRCSHKFNAIEYKPDVRADPAALGLHLRMKLLDVYGYEYGK